SWGPGQGTWCGNGGTAPRPRRRACPTVCSVVSFSPNHPIQPMVRTEVRQRVAVDRTLDGATDGPTKLKSSRVLDGPRSFPPARRIRGSASPDPSLPTRGERGSEGSGLAVLKMAGGREAPELRWQGNRSW